MPPGYPPFRHCHLFFYFFSIFCAQYISVSFPATYTHSRQHIQFGFCLLPELYAFIIFSFRSVLILSQVATLSSGVSRPYLTRSILTNSQARTSRSGLPAITSDISYLLNIQKPATHILLCRPEPLQSPTLPPDALRHLPMPPGYLISPPLCCSLPLLQYPIFSFFSFFHPFSFSLFFLSSFPFFFFFFSLLFLVYTFFFLAFFYLLFCFFHFFFLSIFFITSPCTFLCAPAQRM